METETKTADEQIKLVAHPDDQFETAVSSANNIEGGGASLDTEETDSAERVCETPLAGCVRPRETAREDSFAPTVHNIVHLIRSSTCAEDWNQMYDPDKTQEIDCWRNCRRCGFDILKLSDPSEESLTQALSLRVLKPSQRQVIWRRTDGTFMVDNCAFTRAYPTASGALMLLFIGVLPVIAMYFLSPGFFLPLANHPIGRIIIFCYLFWHVLGCFLFSKTRGSTLTQAAQRVIIVFAFTLPSMLMEIISPAIIQIMLPLGTAMR